MKFAHLSEGVLVDVTSTNPFMIFDAGYAQTFIVVPDEAKTGDRFVEGVLQPQFIGQTNEE